MQKAQGQNPPEREQKRGVDFSPDYAELLLESGDILLFPHGEEGVPRRVPIGVPIGAFCAGVQDGINERAGEVLCVVANFEEVLGGLAQLALLLGAQALQVVFVDAQGEAEQVVGNVLQHGVVLQQVAVGGMINLVVLLQQVDGEVDDLDDAGGQAHCREWFRHGC